MSAAKEKKRPAVRLRAKLIGITALFTALILTVIWLLFGASSQARRGRLKRI